MLSRQQSPERAPTSQQVEPGQGGARAGGRSGGGRGASNSDIQARLKARTGDVPGEGGGKEADGRSNGPAPASERPSNQSLPGGGGAGGAGGAAAGGGAPAGPAVGPAVAPVAGGAGGGAAGGGAAPAAVGFEYQAGPAFHMETEIPWQASFQASARENIIFNVEYTDIDRRRAAGGPWEDVPGEGPYEIRFEATDLHFDTLDTGLSAKVFTGLSTGNVYGYIDSAWAGSTPVTVDLTVRDLAPNKSAPDTGSTKDVDYTHTWTITPRANPAPTAMTETSGTEGRDMAGPATYAYQLNPELTPPGRPCYEHQSVLETFSSVLATFTMADLDPAWRAANPGLTSPDAVAQHLWGSSNNGTFVVDATDQIYDQHSGFGDTTAFTAAALARGIGYILPQQYRIDGKVVGQYLIHRTMRGGALMINKSPGAPGRSAGGGGPAPTAPFKSTVSVVRGDTLSGIAQRELGDSRRWREIYRLNETTIGANPNLIFPGQVLQLPQP